MAFKEYKGLNLVTIGNEVLEFYIHRLNIRVYFAF